MRSVLLSLALLLAAGVPAAADDDPHFRRTTPRAPVAVAAGDIVFGVPAGRAWGLESGLIRIAPGGATVALELGVAGDSVRHAFVRIAWYDRDEGRPRQFAIEDPVVLLPGERHRAVLLLEPPDGAVAFRVRVLARTGQGREASDDDAVTVARVRIDRGWRSRPSLTRLERDGP